MTELLPGIYQHYTGKRYHVLGVGHHSETKEELVVYIALYDSEYGKDAIWVRPKSMFLEMVELDGKKVPRFQFIGAICVYSREYALSLYG